MLSDVLELRRSIYALNKNMPIDNEKVIKIVEQCLKNCPTAFNAQSARVVILFGSNHADFWQMVQEALQKITPAEKLGGALQRVKSFAAAYGTILFFEDSQTLEKMQQQFSLYAESMAIWMQQGNGILSYMIWQCLAEYKVGASLQHYGNLVEKEVIKKFKLPKSWQLTAQMPFGGIAEPAAKKSFLPLDERLLVLY